MLSVCAGFSLATDNANAQAEDNPFSGLYAQAGMGYLEKSSEDYVHFQLGIDKGNNSGWYLAYKGKNTLQRLALRNLGLIRSQKASICAVLNIGGGTGTGT